MGSDWFDWALAVMAVICVAGVFREIRGLVLEHRAFKAWEREDDDER